MLTHLYLPALQEGKSPQIPDTAGKWDTYQQRFLLAVADGIVVDERAAMRGVSSVPDVWARPLMFASALRQGSRHPLRDRLVQEWRGLLSLIALSRVQNYDLELVRVPLLPGVFADALRQLAPAAVRLEAETRYKWTDIVVIRYQKITIGALSPRTLVYTGTDYAGQLTETTLNLKNKAGFLQPPIDREEREAVAKWVVQLQGRLGKILSDQRDDNHDTVGLISGLLNDWANDLRSQLGLGQRDDVNSPEVQIDDDALHVRAGDQLLSTYRVYRELLRPLARVEGGARVVTELALRPSRNLTHHATVVVVTPGLIGSNARIWETKRLSTLGGDVQQVLTRHFDDASGTLASGTLLDREDLGKRNALWIRPERYFLSDTLLKGKDGARFLADTETALSLDASRFVLPFKTEILQFFSPEDIQQLGAEFTRETDQSITFRFKLPVGNGIERVEKTYRYKNPEPGQGVVNEIAVPQVELFPHYLDASWRRYFLFQTGPEGIVAKPVVTADNATTATREHTDSTGNKVRITSTTSDAVWEKDGTLSRLPFPEAVEFATTRGSVVGVILLPRPQQPRARAGQWRIGIDFGTSNTNVFKQSSRAAEAERWVFRFSNYLRPITRPRTAGGRSELFLPDRDVHLPVPTHLRIHQEPQRQHALLDYFMDLSVAYKVPDSVYTNIKWQDKDRKTEFFLESLLLLILVDAVAQRVDSVQFACSYPKAFSQNSISVFKGEWEKVLRRVLEGPTRLLDRRRRADETHLEVTEDAFEVEGVAAGEFFASEKTIPDLNDRANKQNAALCLDVGGGTTDISIWFNDEIVADASVKLAGRQIGEVLRSRFKILELLLSPAAVAALEEHRALPDPFAARLNIALREEDLRIREMLIKHSNSREAQALKRLLVCEFGAIAFYAAQLLAAADRRLGNGELLGRVVNSGIALHWGGNAAKFINWIDFGRFDKSGIGPMILNAIVYNALQDAGATVAGKRVVQHQSPGHKSEAAGGLVVMDLGRKAAGDGESDLEMVTDRRTGSVCGEVIELTTGAISYLDSLSEKDLFKAQKTTFVRTTLERLRRFVEIVNHFGVQRGVFTSDSKITLDDNRAVFIADQVRAQFVTAQGIAEGHREIEPVFIMEIKVLLELLKSDLER